MASGCKKKQDVKGRGLVDVVFSWSIADVLNKDLYKGKVIQIPRTFNSLAHYKGSFICPLLEETHADLLSKLSSISRAPTLQICFVKKCKYFKLPKDLFYKVSPREKKISDFSYEPRPIEPKKNNLLYNPEGGDLVVLTNKRPKCIGDLRKARMLYLLALVRKDLEGEIEILCSRPLEFEEDDEWNKRGRKLFMVYLTSLTTNVRIWQALNLELEGNNIKLIQRVMQIDSLVGEKCSLCPNEDIKGIPVSKMREAICFSNLNDSQQAAVLSCLATRECRHQNIIKLIWGPPGTGKTQMVGTLLFFLLRMKCRTVTCAPTNVAVVGVATRLLSLVRESLQYNTYGLGDIVLFGNGERMKIDDCEDLQDIFLENRIKILEACFSPLSGWSGSLQGMIRLVEDPDELYRLFLEQKKENHSDGDEEVDDVWTFEEFLKSSFAFLRNKLEHLIKNLYTHLPTSVISLKLAKEMMRFLGLLQTIGSLIEKTIDTTKQQLQEALNGPKVSKLRRSIMEFLQVAKFLHKKISVPKYSIQSFCLKNACLIFCTASSSVKLYTEWLTPVELIVIDEAAQLKECESFIPLQLPGLRHAVLIGDEKQLPAMVQSKLCQEAGFGRSLFERLVLLGHGKHLLNVQYRMHPSISRFPNGEFYRKRILDGPNVTQPGYNKCFLEGKMFGSYSFINVTGGKEEPDTGHSMKNLTEVAVVTAIVARLFKESVAKRQRVSVGCISPYKAQVSPIQERLENKYDTEADSDFSVNVRSVDGFQGGEQDVIIISTVRCNGRGSVGFLSDFERTNVSLTRARYCLWIVGDGSTLINSDSVWKRVVLDAKERGCFFNLNEDKDLSQDVMHALVELGLVEPIFNLDSLLIPEASWKVQFDEMFLKTMARMTSTKTWKKVLALLVKLSRGWRSSEVKNGAPCDAEGPSSKLLEQYELDGDMYLIWTVDLQEELSQYVQVIKVWDILLLPEIEELAKRLDKVFRNYTVTVMKRCQAKRVEGSLVHPVTWPKDSDRQPSWSLESELSALSLGPKPRSSRPSFGNRGRSSNYGGAKPSRKGGRRKSFASLQGQ